MKRKRRKEGKAHTFKWIDPLGIPAAKTQGIPHTYLDNEEPPPNYDYQRNITSVDGRPRTNNYANQAYELEEKHNERKPPKPTETTFQPVNVRLVRLHFVFLIIV